MYKIIAVIYLVTLVVTCKPQDNSGNPTNTIDSCSILTKLIHNKWYYSPNLGYFRDSLQTDYIYHNYPAFKKCFNLMTRDDVVKLFGTPTEVTDKYYNYLISPPLSAGANWYNMLEFTFKDNYVSDIGVDGTRVKP